MAKRILGLEIGNANMKLLECRLKGHQYIIEKSKIIETPPESISDGIIWDISRICHILEGEIKKGKYKSKNLAIVIKSSEIITRDIRMDKMPAKDMKAILELQYHEYLLVDITQYQITYKVVRDVEKEEGLEQEILIVAAPNKLLDPLIEIADKLKMKIKSINISSDAVANLFREDSFVMDMREESAMVVDIGAVVTTVTLISDGVSVLSKNIGFGLQELDPLILNHFGSKQIGEIEKFKDKYGGVFDENHDVDLYSRFISEKVKPMLEHKLLAEIRRLLQFHFSRGQHEQIEQIYLIGGGAGLKNIDQYMGELIGIPCSLGIKLDMTQIESNLEVQSKSQHFANILGLISQF